MKKYNNITAIYVNTRWFLFCRDMKSLGNIATGVSLKEAADQVEVRHGKIWTPGATAEQVSPLTLNTTAEGWKYVILP